MSRLVTPQAAMLGIYKALLGPLLLWQAHRLKTTALRLPEASGPRCGLAGDASSAPALRVLFLGDSSAAGVGVDHQAQALAVQAAAGLSARIGSPVQWQLVAQSGVSTREALQLLSAHELRAADVVVTALGVNDVTSQCPPDQFIAHYKALVHQVTQAVGAKLIVVNGLPPLHRLPAAPQPLRWYLGQCAKRLDEQLRQWTRPHAELSFLSLQWATDPRGMARDGFHPGAALYQQWAQRVADVITECVKHEATFSSRSSTGEAGT